MQKKRGRLRWQALQVRLIARLCADSRKNTQRSISNTKHSLLPILLHGFQKSAKPDNIFGTSTLLDRPVSISRLRRQENWIPSDHISFFPKCAMSAHGLGDLKKHFWIRRSSTSSRFKHRSLRKYM